MKIEISTDSIANYFDDFIGTIKSVKDRKGNVDHNSIFMIFFYMFFAVTGVVDFCTLVAQHYELHLFVSFVMFKVAIGIGLIYTFFGTVKDKVNYSLMLATTYLLGFLAWRVFTYIILT